MTNEETTLRRIERTVLDRQHNKYRLLQRNANDAIESLLRCYGDILRGLRNGSIPKNSDDEKHQTANEGFRGLAHCVRWIQARCPRRIVCLPVGENQLIEEALELLRWGVIYDKLYSRHVGYSRKVNGTRWVNARVDETRKTIEFLPQSDIPPRFFVSQVEAHKREFRRQAPLYPDAKFARHSTSFFQSVSLVDGGMQFDDTQIASSGSLAIALEWLRSTCLPELLDGDSLEAFSASRVRRVLATLHVASLFRERLEDHFDQRDSREKARVVTQVLSWTRNEFLDWLQSIMQGEREEVDSIVELFTFDRTPERATLAHKPLVLGADNRVFLLPRLFLVLPLSETVVGALNLNETTRSPYDRVSGTIERRVVERIARELRDGVFRSASIVWGQTFSLPDGSTMSPDIVLLSADGSELLVVEVKNATPPFGVGDTVYDVTEWHENWTPQLDRYVNAFRNHPQILSEHFGNGQATLPRVFGLILLRWPLPIPVRIPDTFTAIDWPTLKEKLANESRTGSIKDLWCWIRERPDVSVVEQLQWRVKEVELEGWRYRYSNLIVPDPQ